MSLQNVVNKLDDVSKSQQAPRSKVGMFIVCLLFSCIGLHRILMGYRNWLLYVITLGGLGIWWIYDLVSIATGKMKMADGQDLT